MIKVSSSVPYGSGALIAHKSLESRLDNYEVVSYNPYWALFPPALSFIGNRTADIIHAPVDYAVFSSIKDVPLVVTFHSYFLDKDIRPYSSTAQNIHYATDLRWFVSLALKRAERVTAVSQYVADRVYSDLGYRGTVKVVHNGIDTGVFRPEPGRQKHEQVDILFVGNLTRRKGADLLPAIAARLEPGIKIRFTTGFRQQVFFSQAENLINIGQVPYQSMPALYNTADILLFPTVREGFGLAALEAMACGLPVVATDCSALPELIDDGKGGYLCAPGNVEMFADRIKTLAQSPRLRREMGEYNRQKVMEKFTVDRMAGDYKILFEEVLS